MKYSVGMTGEYSKLITEEDINAFATVSGDYNPVHIDDKKAKQSMFGKRVAHGMLTVSFISKVIGTIMPGEGTIYLSQNVDFLKPVFINDTVRAVVTITEMGKNNKATLITEVFNQDNEKVISGSALVKLPQ